MEAIDRISIDLLNTETGQRGFLITRENKFLEPYLQASKELDEDIQQLTYLFPEGRHSDLIAEIIRLTTEKQMELRTTISLANSGAWGEAVNKVRSGDGKRIMDQLRAALKDLRKDERYRLEIQESSSASKAWIVVFGTGLTALFGIFITIRSASRVKRESSARQQAYAEIERAIEIRTWELRDALERLARSDAAKSDFLAVMSHELRTPLTTVVGYAKLLKEDSFSDQQKSEYIDAIHAAGDVLRGVVNEVLDFAALERGGVTVHWEPVDVWQLVQKVVVAMRPPSHSERLIAEIKEPLPARILADEDKLRQVIINLVANALKFTPNGNVIVRCRTEGSERLVVEVVDSGIGISEDALPRLFEPFTQAESTTRRRFGGVGLGLAICKKFVESMEGSITVKSRCGEGSTFSFWLPLKIPSEEELAVAFFSPNRDLFPSIRCLVVDDNLINRKLVVTMLSKLGVKASSVGSGEDCLVSFRKTKFDIIFMDLEMPEMDGFDTTREIRRIDQSIVAPKIKIFALTGDVARGVKDRCLKAGMDGYISKPIRTQDLYEALQKVTKLNDSQAST